MGDLLLEITRDERIMAAAACNADLTLLAGTADYPNRFSCADLGVRLRPHPDAAVGTEWLPWHSTAAVAGGNVFVSANPISDGDAVLGFVVLVHDLSFIELREVKAQQFLWAAFAVLAAILSVVGVVTARYSWRRWTAEIRRLLRGGPHSPEFQPIWRDVRELVERLGAEADSDSKGGPWTAERLKQTLHRHLHGEKIIIVANREPYIHDRAANGSIRVLHPASGLVTALEPVMRACSGVWVAHGGGSADRESADRSGRVKVPPGEESYVVRRVWLSAEEEQGYYYGFSNEGLWPLCHIAHHRPIFRTSDWKHYQAVNRRFAEAVCEEADSDDPIILVQDYHFALAPQMIHKLLPRATILTFWHIPWPNAERMAICPWRDELLEGLLGSSIVGFHTRQHCNNFLDAVDSFLEARIDREQTAVVQHRRTTLVRPYPISIEWPSRWMASSPSIDECQASVLAELDLPRGTRIGIGVDRLDYTKGVEERFLAVEQLLERVPSLRGKFTFVQLAAPSRTAIEHYRVLNETVERVAARINDRFAQGRYRPIVFLRAHHEPPTVFRFLRAACLCYVSSLHDGMNLVAKEYVAAHDDEQGVLVLSRFTGAARELTEALIVNPYDLDEASKALAFALEMPADEQRDRMRSMRSFVAEFNVYRWAGRMLVDASRLRRRERLTGRLAAGLSARLTRERVA
jgi:trehalose 6-phosphate synthase